MIQLNFNKQMQSAYNHYKRSKHSDNLLECYNNPSWYKINAMVYCRKLCEKYNGYNLKIIGYNCMQFSVGFECMINNKKHFAYITKNNEKICCVE